jgi:hypothetical protein
MKKDPPHQVILGNNIAVSIGSLHMYQDPESDHEE